ncbi:MAG: exostosin domain-containing protein [bacterium]
MAKIVNTPETLTIRTNHCYPPNNHVIFEDYFRNYFTNNKIETERYYIPVQWTSFYLSRKNGKGNMFDLQNYLNNIDKSKKYFTVLQYDDGIINDISHLDLFVFASGGGGKNINPNGSIGDYKIPLICQPDPYANKNLNKTILASFVGSLNNRHIARDVMKSTLSDKNDIIISNILTYDKFKNLMETSIFSLAPRGYGATSFRICEALQHGSIPVYIHDDNKWIPFESEFDFNDIGISIHYKDLFNLYDIMKSKTPEEINTYRKNGDKIYNEYFTYIGCSDKIIKLLKKNEK